VMSPGCAPLDRFHGYNFGGFTGLCILIGHVRGVEKMEKIISLLICGSAVSTKMTISGDYNHQAPFVQVK
jgi:hypothetical protein